MTGEQRAARPGYWFPLLLFGGLAALSPPLYVLASPPLPTGMAVFTRVVYPNVAEAMYLGGGSANPPFDFPLGWYWVGVLIAGFLLTAAWYRWRDRRTGGRTPLRGYLVTGLALAAVMAALPLTGLGMSTMTADPPMAASQWLDVLWQWGIFALLAVAVGLALLAWQTRSPALAVITAVYAVAVCFVGWFDLQQAIFDPAFFPLGDPTVLLPAAVLLLAGLGALLTAGVRALGARRSPPAQPAGGSHG